MRLYTDERGLAPSPRRVRIVLAEKGVDVDLVPMRIHEENRTPAFREKNPVATLPVLELDDGTCLAESLAICRYLEELHPEPSLFGTTPLERAVIEMWTKRAELMLYLPIEFLGADFPEPMRALFADGTRRAMRFLDREIEGRPFVAGARYSIADIVAQVALDFGRHAHGVEIPGERANLRRWYAEVSSRPSARA